MLPPDAWLCTPQICIHTEFKLFFDNSFHILQGERDVKSIITLLVLKAQVRTSCRFSISYILTPPPLAHSTLPLRVFCVSLYICDICNSDISIIYRQSHTSPACKLLMLMTGPLQIYSGGGKRWWRDDRITPFS